MGFSLSHSHSFSVSRLVFLKWRFWCVCVLLVIWILQLVWLWLLRLFYSHAHTKVTIVCAYRMLFFHTQTLIQTLFYSHKYTKTLQMIEKKKKITFCYFLFSFVCSFSIRLNLNLFGFLISKGKLFPLVFWCLVTKSLKSIFVCV